MAPMVINSCFHESASPRRLALANAMRTQAGMKNNNLKITEIGVSQGGGGHSMFQAKPNPNLWRRLKFIGFRARTTLMMLP
jgi:hypothetical protein